MKTYIKPSAEFVKLDIEDIIQTSTETPDTGFTKQAGIEAQSAGEGNWLSSWN